jgi:hypothetical protein
MKLGRMRFIFRFLILLGLVVSAYGLAGILSGHPIEASNFASAVMNELKIDNNPKVFEMLCDQYRDSHLSSSQLRFIVGTLIFIPAIIGLWSIPNEP